MIKNKKIGASMNELKETTQKLIQSEKMASLGMLSAGVAHEINNPMNFVTANLSALQLDFEELLPLMELVQQLNENKTPETLVTQLQQQSKDLDLPFLLQEVKQLLVSIDNGAKRTHKIVHSLGMFSRNTSERFLPADINEGIQSTLILMKGSLPQSIAIQTQLSPLPTVICQITRLNQVFLNLINNAVQAIEGQGQIIITTTQPTADQIEITIADTGIGMTEATQQRVFEPFFTTKAVGQGTGLGLSVSYGIITQHEGEISVESTPGQGTTFRILLPIHHATTTKPTEK